MTGPAICFTHHYLVFRSCVEEIFANFRQQTCCNPVGRGDLSVWESTPDVSRNTKNKEFEKLSCREKMSAKN